MATIKENVTLYTYAGPLDIILSDGTRKLQIMMDEMKQLIRLLVSKNKIFVLIGCINHQTRCLTGLAQLYGK